MIKESISISLLNECGFIGEGIVPKTGSCEDGRQWFIRRNEYQERGSYEPAPGDICIWNIHVNVYAGEEGGKKVWYDFSRNCISDKKPDSGTYVKYIRKGNIGQTLYKVLRLKDQDSYGSGKPYDKNGFAKVNGRYVIACTTTFGKVGDYIDFVVNKSMWYSHLGNTDITRFHPEWKSRVKMGVNLGKNFFGK